MNRILWNRRPINPMRGDCGEIDEIVIRNAETVHVEQMDTRCWWIGIYMADGTYWMGNFIADSRGRMRFSEQENAGIEWQHDATHEPADDEVLSLAEADAHPAGSRPNPQGRKRARRRPEGVEMTNEPTSTSEIATPWKPVPEMDEDVVHAGVMAERPARPAKPEEPPTFTCDWGYCDNESTDSRWAADLGMWLGVCTRHVTARSNPKWGRS